MIAGTGTVFVFLCLMVIVMMAVGAYFKANEARYREDSSADSGGTAKSEEMASIVAAIAVSLNMQSNTNKTV